MRHWLYLLVLMGTAAAAQADDSAYQLGPDSQRQAGVPRGKVTKHEWTSKIFPGTKRDYWVYVPAQYDESKPAAVMVFQDGHTYVSEDGDFRVPIVFDNLIHKGEMPAAIGVFINPGHKGEGNPASPWRANNRSFEYDTLSDQYARFLLEEILPEVGKSHRLTDDPNRRAICGISSGGICAWTAAWERPGAFRKVLSHVGSFTNIRGGNVYPAHPQNRAQADPRLPAGRGKRSGQRPRQLVAVQPANGRRPQVPKVRLQIRRGRRRPQRQTRRCDPAGLPPLAVAGSRGLRIDDRRRHGSVKLWPWRPAFGFSNSRRDWPSRWCPGGAGFREVGVPRTRGPTGSTSSPGRE